MPVPHVHGFNFILCGYMHIRTTSYIVTNNFAINLLILTARPA